MKIAFFVNAFPMMSEAFIANSAAALVEAGHTVDIFGIGNTDATGLSVPEVEPFHLEQVTTNIRWPKSVAARWLHLPEALTDVARHHGLAGLARLRPDIYRRSMINLSAAYQVAHLPVQADYDILHCQFAPLAEHVIKHRKAGFLTGRIVVNFRGYDISEVIDACGPHVYDSMWPEAEGYIANCEFFRQRAVSIGCPEDRISVVGSGIRLDGFPFQPIAAVASDEPKFLMVGRLIERKGFHIALEALARFVKATGQRIRVDIVGEGVLRPRLTELAEAHGLGDMVVLHGAQDHAAIAGFISDCDVFIAPSMTCPKGSQDGPVNTVKEAMAIGRPVVATRHGGISELVIDNETGVLCEEGDVASLEEAIHRILSLQPAWPEMLANARKSLAERYALDKTTDDLLKVYQAVLNSSETPRLKEEAA